MKKLMFLIMFVGVLWITNFSVAQTNLYDQLYIEPIQNQPQEQITHIQINPAASMGSPTGYGAGFGDIFSSGFYSSNRRAYRDQDGSASFGIGLGDPERYVGLEAEVGVYSVAGLIGQDGGVEDFGASGAGSFKLSHTFPTKTGIGVGWLNALPWGEAELSGDTYYGVISQTFILSPNKTYHLPIVLSAGGGNGWFRFKTDVENEKENAVGIFGSIGIYVHPQVSLTSSWAANELNFGLSTVPIRQFPLAITVGVGDALEEYEHGSKLILIIGTGYNFLKL